jgi:hypothetical protein
LPRPLLDAATTATLPFSPRSTHLSKFDSTAVRLRPQPTLASPNGS